MCSHSNQKNSVWSPEGWHSSQVNFPLCYKISARLFLIHKNRSLTLILTLTLTPWFEMLVSFFNENELQKKIFVISHILSRLRLPSFNLTLVLVLFILLFLFNKNFFYLNIICPNIYFVSSFFFPLSSNFKWLSFTYLKKHASYKVYVQCVIIHTERKLLQELMQTLLTQKKTT